MIISRIKLKNWRNFAKIDVNLKDRIFVLGANAAGKSNFLDAFRFVNDIVKPKGGGLQAAIELRDSFSKIRCLSARRDPGIELEFWLTDENNCGWRYKLGLRQEKSGSRRPLVDTEEVSKITNGQEKIILTRPDAHDKLDNILLTQTAIEQVNLNKDFRGLVEFFGKINYTHLVPQLVKNPHKYSGPGIPGDPYGRDFMQKVARTSKKIRESRLKKIEAALRLAVPQLKALSEKEDNSGAPHLEAVYEHWRPKGAKQNEKDFSDGTLRLIGLLWTLFENDSVLLLEEPELSLHEEVIQTLPTVFEKIVSKSRKKQIIISTHNTALLKDKSIGTDEVLLLKPTEEGTQMQLFSQNSKLVGRYEAGIELNELIINEIKPKKISQITLLDWA